MFCTKCGQQQGSEDVRFCFACGAKLGRGEGASSKRIIAMLMHIVLTALAIAGWGPWSGPMYGQIRVLVVSVSVITFLLLFLTDLKHAWFTLFHEKADHSDQETSSSLSASRTSSQVGSAPRQSALPPVSSVPVNSFGQRGKTTGELFRSRSITEHTTELLDKD